MLTKDAQRLSHGFVKALRGELDGMLDAVGIEASDLTGAKRHVAER
jgi:hypothetical protein